MTTEKKGGCLFALLGLAALFVAGLTIHAQVLSARTPVQIMLCWMHRPAEVSAVRTVVRHGRWQAGVTVSYRYFFLFTSSAGLSAEETFTTKEEALDWVEDQIEYFESGGTVYVQLSSRYREAIRADSLPIIELVQFLGFIWLLLGIGIVGLLKDSKWSSDSEALALAQGGAEASDPQKIQHASR